MKPGARRRCFHLILAALAAGMFAQATTAAEATDPFAENGWYSWRVDAVANARDWCCHQWNAGHAMRETCNLDHPRLSYGHAGDDSARQASTGELQLYARFESGALDRLVTLSPDCAVASAEAWTDLGKIDETQSLHWLLQGKTTPRFDADERLVAVAAHAGEAGRRELVRIARSGGSPKQREQAIFWMGQLRIDDSRDDLLALIEDGESRRIREQAIFSYAQSPAGDRLDVLIGVIEDRHRDLYDRKQALFWLAQADDGAGVDYIQELLLKR